MSHLVPTLALGLALASLAPAQIDLPDRSGRDTTPPGLSDGRTGDVAPHLTCTVCYEANYTTKIDWQAENRLQKAFCTVCRRPRLHRLPSQGGDGSEGGLDLPQGARTPARGEPPVDRPEGGATVADQRTLEGQLSRAAEDILVQLSRVKHADDPVAVQAVETLLSLGGPGRIAARLALANEHGPKMLTGVRVLLRSGVAEDAEVVVARLRRRVPNRVAAAAVTELIESDPVRATPELLCDLLDHPQHPVRARVHRHLQGLDPADYVPFLAGALESDQGDTRLRAVDLLAGADHPLRRDLLLSCLADRRAKVAHRVVEALAGIEDEELDTLLSTRAFGERWVLRPAAYALLAIMEREDRNLEPILGPGHAEHLLRGLQSSSPFVSGTCAAALAGIGFRSEDPAVSEWLDRRVPDRLVRVVSGFEFFDDYAALRETALRRLRLLAGVGFGTDGPAWAEWWLEAREGFVASRAVIPIEEGDESRLTVAVSDRATGEAFVLVGPGLAEGAPSDRGEVFYLGPEASGDLLRFLAEQGVFGTGRLPGLRGTMVDQGRVVEVRVGDRGKSFIFGFKAREPWFDRVFGRARALVERNRWQRYPHPERHGDRLSLYRSEGAWWSAQDDPDERAARLKSMILERALALPAAERSAEVEALAKLYEDPEQVDVEDFPVLLELLSDERWFAERARRVARLARRASGLVEGEPLAPEVEERLWELVGVLHGTYSADAMPELADLLVTAGDRFARRAAVDERAILRAVSTVALADDPGDEELAALEDLLSDPLLNVEVAAVEAIGHHRVQALRGEVLLRARLGKEDVRLAALEAIGRLGGTQARDILTTTLTDSDDRFRLAAVRGLANLQDPRTAPLLISLLRNRGIAEAAPIVREALLDLGEAAHDELFLSMRSPSRVLRRDSALLLAHQMVPTAAPVLMEALAHNPADREVARELAILTCVDERDEVDPAEAWFRWWDSVKHGDALAWLRAAAESRGVEAPEPGAFEGGGTRDAIGFLIEVMRLDEDFLAERARRELQRLIGREVGDLPPHGVERERWLMALLEVLEEQR